MLSGKIRTENSSNTTRRTQARPKEVRPKASQRPSTAHRPELWAEATPECLRVVISAGPRTLPSIRKWGDYNLRLTIFERERREEQHKSLSRRYDSSFRLKPAGTSQFQICSGNSKKRFWKSQIKHKPKEVNMSTWRDYKVQKSGRAKCSRPVSGTRMDRTAAEYQTHGIPAPKGSAVRASNTVRKCVSFQSEPCQLNVAEPGHLRAQS